MDKVEVAIVGAGVVGLAIAWKLANQTKQTIVVIEKNHKYGQETSSRNSEVIHSGLYYSPTMLKSQLCINGNPLLYEFCEKKKVTHKKCGKILVTRDETEEEQLENLYNNALLNTVKVKRLTKEEILEMEPEVSAHSGLYFPNSGTIDVHSLMQALYYEARQAGVIFLFNTIVKGIEYTGSSYQVSTDKEVILSQAVINSAGLGAEKLSQLVGIDSLKNGYQLHPCKGEYFKIKRKMKIRHLVYSVPTANSLGIHVSMDTEGYLRLGPNAYYINELDYNVDEDNKEDFFKAAKQYLPSLKREDLMPDFAGIRPKLQKENEEIKDFVIKEESELGFPRWINLVGIESPGLTACLAIGEYVNKLLYMSS